jgi:phosphoribosylformylglycinamidine synthase
MGKRFARGGRTVDRNRIALDDADRDLVTTELDREPTPTEAALFENLWSEHCAYRSSRPLLSAFDSTGEQVVLGPGDDAAVVALPTGDNSHGDDGRGGENEGNGSESDDSAWYVTLGIESHNHPSFVDPYDGAATGVGGIVRDTLSMGAYPIALADCLYFGDFDREFSKYLTEGVVEGIADYANAIGVPTVTGSVAFHPGYVGNPLVNVACVGLLPADRLVTAEAKRAGNALVLVGNSTGRDGLGGASFASEDLAEGAETADRPAVQVGDPYTEKLLIEANEVLCDERVVESARDLGAAGLGGASSELVAKGGLGAEIDLGRVHQREPNMAPVEVLLAESQERMCYEVAPENVSRVREIAARFELGCSVIGEVTGDRYVCTAGDERVVDLPAAFLADGAPAYDRQQGSGNETENGTGAAEGPERDLPDVPLDEAFATVVGSPNTASKEWVYRQYDHEVGLRTRVGPGDDAALLAIREAGGEKADGGTGEASGTATGSETGMGIDLAFAAGAEPNWTARDPSEGARAIALEVATNLAVKGATPLAAVDCLNGGNPENARTFGAFAETVSGIADACSDLSVPVVGGNVSLYNDSASGPVPPTPTLAMIGTAAGDSPAPPTGLRGDGVVMVVGDRALAGNHGTNERGNANDANDADGTNEVNDDREGEGDHGGDDTARLGGSEYLARFEGDDRFPALPDDFAERLDAIREIARDPGTLAAHDVSHGGLAVTFAEMVGDSAGLDVTIGDGGNSGDAAVLLFGEAPGRAVIETTAPERVRDIAAGRVPVAEIGTATDDTHLTLAVGGEKLSFSADSISVLRDVIADGLD